jgi:hypothetical protein
MLSGKIGHPLPGDQPLAAALAAATRPRPAALTWTAGATTLTRAVSVTLTLRSAALPLTTLTRSRGTLTAKTRMSGRRLALCLTRRAMSAVTLPIAIRIELPAAGAEREIRSLPLRSMPFGPWERRTNQGAMNRPFVALGVAWLVLLDKKCFGGVGLRRRGGYLSLLFGFHSVHVPVDIIGRNHFFRSLQHVRILHILGRNAGTSFDELRRHRAGFAAPGRRKLRLFVLVIRVARRTPRLFDGVVDHRHDRMIGNAALTRTVVVENVTEPEPALLH